jgi:hypothetical protein
MTHTSLPSTLSSVFNPLCDGIPIVCLARPRAVIFNSFSSHTNSVIRRAIAPREFFFLFTFFHRDFFLFKRK